MKRGSVQRYGVSGTVTFRGVPVPTGTIAFEPDARQGNDGPAGYADIVAGRYRTHLGAVGGPHLVRITGASGDAEDELVDTTLFRDYVTTCDLPGQATTLDFDVPEDAAKRRRPR
jgi:hypothetical protein